MLTSTALPPHPIRWGIWRVFMLVLLAGCAGITTRPQPPAVSLTGLELVQLGATEQRFRVRLQIHNPNSFALPIQSLDYVLRLDDEAFAQGSSEQPTTIPALGDSPLELLVSANLRSLIRHTLTLGTGNALRYNLSGSIALASSLLRIPFSKEGKITLQELHHGG